MFWMISTEFITQITRSSSVTNSVFLMDGNVMRNSFRKKFAPSISAASYISGDTPCSAASSICAKNGMPRHTTETVTAGSAVSLRMRNRMPSSKTPRRMSGLLITP